MQIPEHPFSIVAFAPFLPAEMAANTAATQPLPIQSADHGLALLRPSLYIPLPKSLSPEAGILLEFTSLADFAPDAMVERTPWLRALRDGSRVSAQAQSTAAATTLDSILDMVDLPGDREESTRRADTEGNEADAIIAGVLTRISADDDFRRMEAAWQGVALLFEAAGAEQLRLALVPVTRGNAAEVLASSGQLLDDDPPDLLVLDAPFDATPVGILLLEAAANLAERQMSPAICWFGPDFFHLDAWSGLEHLPYLPHHLEGFSFAQWKALRAQPAAFWTIAACNRFSLTPSSHGDVSSELFRQSKPNFLAPVWGVAALLMQSHARTGSPLGIASQLLRVQDADIAGWTPLETAITGDRTRQMAASGLLPLVLSRGKGIHLAEAVTIKGESMLAPLILSTIIHTLIDLRQKSGPSSEPDHLAGVLNEVFSRHPRLKGVLPAGAITFEVVSSDAQGRVLLDVMLRHRESCGKNIEFTFMW
ncbi:type VI secretion system contractile sheath domain-containing protein [uncultured Desulfobulbus sp.]|uniref:type VI secretion system contractile sheath domain-containing protein n=1 Tax=uncultured Desulfobulbus sp. TaxID=239745 RepID=UPI0029C8658F|nr:type VI secretion system contractile sheath large subunit [uncultured Desulfobulbus sp.]